MTTDHPVIQRTETQQQFLQGASRLSDQEITSLLCVLKQATITNHHRERASHKAANEAKQAGDYLAERVARYGARQIENETTLLEQIYRTLTRPEQVALPEEPTRTV